MMHGSYHKLIQYSNFECKVNLSISETNVHNLCEIYCRDLCDCLNELENWTSKVFHEWLPYVNSHP